MRHLLSVLLVLGAFSCTNPKGSIAHNASTSGGPANAPSSPVVARSVATMGGSSAVGESPVVVRSAASAGGRTVSASASAPPALPKFVSCGEIQNAYAEQVKPKLQVCEKDGDCRLQMGSCGVGLGDCFYFVSERVSESHLRALLDAWLAMNCQEGAAVCDCMTPPDSVGCGAQGRCEAK